MDVKRAKEVYKKNELLFESVKVMETEKISKWYHEKLENKNQRYTITVLEFAVKNKELTIYEALHIAFIVGVQWDVKFEGVE